MALVCVYYCNIASEYTAYNMWHIVYGVLYTLYTSIIPLIL